MEIDLSIKTPEYYRENKKKFNRNHNYITKKFVSRSAIGSCSYLYNKYNPENIEDFYEKYTNDYDKDFNLDKISGKHEFGRSKEQLKLLACKYYYKIIDFDKKNKIKSDITIQNCYDDLVNHIIIETFNGHFIERYLRDKFIENGKWDIYECNGYIDAELGVDLMLKHKEYLVVKCIQIKPKTFFKGKCYHNKSLIADRKNLYRKRYLLEQYFKDKKSDYKVDFEIMVYNTDVENGNVEILQVNNKRRFKIEDLIDVYGNLLIDVNECEFIKI